MGGNPLTFFHFNRPFALNILRTSMPAAINEIIWSFGITTYNAVYARIGTDAIAAIQINATIEELMFVVFIGLGNACSVMVGNKIGEGKKDTAFEYGRRFTILGVLSALAGGIFVLLIRDLVIGLYELSPSAVHNLRWIMLVYSLSIWLRVFNFMLFIGGFVLHLPVYGVYAMVLTEEAVKAIVILRRYLSRKWIHDLVNITTDQEPAPLSSPGPAS